MHSTAALLAAASTGTDDLAHNVGYLLVIAVVAAVAPMIVGLLRLKIAEVVLLLGLGILVGPEVLGWVEDTTTISTFSEVGLGMLFFLAGYELDQAELRGRAGRLGGIGWLVSLALAFGTVGLLVAAGQVSDLVGVAIALTSTALGTLLPVIRDSGRLDTPFGRLFMGAGAFGEFGPVLATSLFLSASSPRMAILSLVLFAAFAWIVAVTPGRLRSGRVPELLERGHRTTSQTALRWTVVLLLFLLALSYEFGLDVVLGAFVAGLILKRYSPRHEDNVLVPKIEALGFGLFIPLFFVVSGVTLDVRSIIENPAPTLFLFALLFLVRGLPQWFLYRRDIPDPGPRWQFSLYVATGLPIIVAITSLEVANGAMGSESAAALVGAGALSVLVFPLLGDRLGGRTVAARPPQGGGDSGRRT